MRTVVSCSAFRTGLGLAAALACAAAAAQNYPTRAVRMVVPFAPGGASDVVGRIIAPRFSQELGQQIVVDNRAGAAGQIGVEAVARAAPDGYTILLGNSGTMVINPGLYPKASVVPLRDLMPVTQVVDVPGGLVVHPSLPVSSVKQLIGFAKARPGKLDYGSAGPSSPQRLAMEYFLREAGLKMMHIPYKGGAGAATVAVVAGEVSVVMTSISAVLPHVNSGKLRGLGVVAPKRLAVAPQLPTMAESGFPALTTGSWQGVYAPAGTPAAIVSRLFAASHRVMTDADVTRRLNDTGTEVVLSRSSEEFMKFMKAETALWGKVITDIGLTVD